MPTPRPRKPVHQWTDPRHRHGYAGERAAMTYLLRRGWRIEAHRFKWGRHDVDLVARLGSVVAFIEVKARRSARFGRAAEAVGWRKRRVLTRAAEAWRSRFGFADDRYRFDLITVEQLAGAAHPEVTHIENAWS
jgi:putative endonuclease